MASTVIDRLLRLGTFISQHLLKPHARAAAIFRYELAAGTIKAPMVRRSRSAGAPEHAVRRVDSNV